MQNNSTPVKSSASSFLQKPIRIILFSFFLLAVFLAFIPYKISIPEQFKESLKEYELYLKSDQMTFTLLPYPNLEIPKLYLNMPGTMELEVKNTIFSVDLISLWLNSDYNILAASIDYAYLKVVPDIIPDPDEKINIESVIHQVQTITDGIAENLNLPKRIAIDYFELETFQFPGKILVFSKKFVLTETEIGHSIELEAGMGNWLESRIDINLYSAQNKEGKNKTKKVNIFLKHTLRPQKIYGHLSEKPLSLNGELHVKQFLTFEPPTRSVRFFNKINVHTLKIPGKLEVIPNDETMIFADGEANLTGIRAQMNWQARGIIGAPGNIEWKYDEKKITIETANKSNFDMLSPMIARSQPKTISKIIQSFSGGFYLHRFIILPWDSDILVSMHLALKGKSSPSYSSPLFVDGNLFIDSGSIRSPKITITYKKSKFLFSKFLLWQNKNTASISARINSLVDLSDFISGANGNIGFLINLNCTIQADLHCNSTPFAFRGSRLNIPAGVAARILRFMSFNISVFGKSLQKKSEVEISKFDIWGHFTRNQLKVKKSDVRSDIGIFNITGGFNPIEGNGELVVRHSPFSAQSIFRRIPLLGKPLKFSVDLAAELIFRISVNDYIPKLEDWSVGKGVDTVKQLFGKE